jgi:vacuolar-type H+-ATPase subunit C/Vma6
VSWPALVARARGLAGRRLAVRGDALEIEQALQVAARTELEILARWGEDALVAIELDEDRRSLRTIIRGLAGAVVGERRLAGTVPTRSLPASVLAQLAAATSLAEIAGVLAKHRHPYAALVVGDGAVDVLAIELALARRFTELARGAGDSAMHAYASQVIDVENAAAAMLLAERGGKLAPEDAFLGGGKRLDRAAFLAACGDATHTRLALEFAGTPLAQGVLATSPAAFEDAALRWSLATQARLRLLEPDGLAAVLSLVVRRRVEARDLRRDAWRRALGGAA